MARSRSKRRDDDDDDGAPKPKSDAYVGLLAISFLALLVGVVLLYVDYDELAKQTVPQPQVSTSEDGLSRPGTTPAKG